MADKAPSGLARRDLFSVAFAYPLANHPNLLIKRGKLVLQPAGPEADAIAFSALRSLMRGYLTGRYRHDARLLGGFLFHFSVLGLR